MPESRRPSRPERKENSAASHDGAIAVRSEPGKGSLFTLHFPATDEVRTVQQLEDLSCESRGSAERVLYVDDDEVLVYLVERRFGRLGYEVTGATTAHRAQRFKGHRLFRSARIRAVET